MSNQSELFQSKIRPGEISRLLAWRAQLGARVFSSSEGKAITPTDSDG
jgi:hypothetical protein